MWKKEERQEVAKVQPTHSERFAQAVEREFSGGVSEIQLTGFQRKLCQNYFIKIDSILKDAEAKRMAKAEKYREPLAFNWGNVNMQQLAVDVIAYSGVGLDPTQPNHINPIPYKNKDTGKYDIGFIPGYRGAEIKAKKYGLEIPDDVIVELVYATDQFKQFKKDINNKVETYEFHVTDNFNRGEIVGGFYYHKYFNNPEKNKIRVFSRKDIEKRKPDYASAEFWGGEKDKWEYDAASGKNKVVGKVEVEGWFDEMAYKTIYKAAFSAITIDSQKIDENYMAVIQKEINGKDAAVLKEISEFANKNEIGFNDSVPVQTAEVVHDQPTAVTASASTMEE
ncbi:MAG: recombinational DNA repair protein (RecE pathway), partial [Chitinophagaceae bacterium]